MKKTAQAILILGLLTVISTGGTAIVANARGNSSALTATPAGHMAQAANNEEDSEGPEPQDHAEEAAEIRQYEALAKITSQQARQTAEAARAATATKVALDANDGSLVYEVKFADAEVLVDAGNGRILKTELAGQEATAAQEVPIQGSIRVPDHDQEPGEIQP